MKKRLQIILKIVLKEHKDILYGSNSEIVVNEIDWIRSKQCHMITVTIYTDNIKESVESHPDGIEFMINTGWPILGKNNKPIVISTLDVK